MGCPEDLIGSRGVNILGNSNPLNLNGRLTHVYHLSIVAPVCYHKYIWINSFLCIYRKILVNGNECYKIFKNELKQSDIMFKGEGMNARTAKNSIKTIAKKSKPLVTSSKQSDLSKHAWVSSSPPIPTDSPTMDSTSVQEISRMLNANYSPEIIKGAAKGFNLEKLQKLRKINFNDYLKEGKEQILGLWHSIEALTVHTELFNVTFLIAIGQILNDVELAFGKKSSYMSWLRGNFSHRHLRYFQHAKQLANMGEFARRYAAIGKNRLLDFVRLKAGGMQTHEDLMRRYPLPDITKDHDGILFKQHVDGIITYHRLQDAGIGFVEFDQAALIASRTGGALTVKGAKQIVAWLGTFKKKDAKKEALDDLILNHMQFPSAETTPSQRPQSLRELFAELIRYSERVNMEDPGWVESAKDEVDQADLIGVYQLILDVAGKLNIGLTPGTNAKIRGGAKSGRPA